MPFWQTADGSLWEAEGSFGRYVDSLAPYFDEIVLSVPVFSTPPASGSRLRAANVRLAPLPYFPGPRQFYPMLPAMHRRLRDFIRQCDVIHLRVPTPAAIFAFRLARAANKPVFLLVVGDYQALLPHLGYRGLKKTLFAAYVAFEEWALKYMTTRSLTFANGAALRRKHEQQGATVIETKTTTLALADIASRTDTCGGSQIKCLTVSRIDPRKGLRVLPEVIAMLVAAGHDVTLDIVGPTIGQIGDTERDAIAAEARRLGVADRVRLLGPIPLDQLMPLYQQYDVFVLPTQPGEGIPRVLMEAMAAGLPVITTNVSGIASLIEHEQNGLLVSLNNSASSVSSTFALRASVDKSAALKLSAALIRVIEDSALRRRLISGGYQTARAHTLENQAAEMMRVVSSELQPA
ncbi:MAG: glycosyltransferase family 4 protein [Acidobacteriota bacterium]|nr:glycosyltransferase family 4 protein [Acidobacteriota bacterium]